MTTVHPTFNPVEKLWFIDDSDAVAETIRALLRQLPPGTRVKDYYPRGYGSVVKPRNANVAKTTLWRNAPPKKYEKSLLPEPQKETVWETITEETVAAALHKPEPVVEEPEVKVLPVEVTFRKLPPPGTKVNWVKEDARLIAMFNAQRSDHEIAAAIGTTKNAIVGRRNRLGLLRIK